MRRPLLLVLLAGSRILAQNITFATVEPSVVEQRFARLRPKNDERASVLREIFHEAGCTDEHWAEVKVRGSKLPNLICTLAGSSARQVIVTAHYDQTGGGQGAIDNWSGASLLPSLYQSLSNQPRTLTFVFVLTMDEEKGMVGSRDFASHLSPEQVRNTVANVNIDSIGLPGQTYLWASRAAPELLNATALIASAMKLNVGPMNIDGVGESDSRPFLDRRIPVIDFHSLTGKTITLLHSKKDVPEAINSAAYYDTFHLITGLLAYLDAKADPEEKH